MGTDVFCNFVHATEHRVEYLYWWYTGYRPDTFRRGS